MTRVVLFQIRDPKIKLARLTEAAASHFEKKERLIIFVEDEKTLQYVDELLWKTPPSGFLPHIATDGLTEELIAITNSKKNLNSAKMAFNLCSTPLLIDGPLKIIYDFEDLTSPHKKNLSSIRFDAYKQAQFLIESRS
jgi:DNA polymerase IIIc chi subunit